MNRTFVLTIAAALAAFANGSSVASAQSAKDLIGTWIVVSNVLLGQDGSRTPNYGPNGTGLGIFEANGRFAVVNINPDTPKFASNNRVQGTVEENKAAVVGSIALYGTYTVADKVINMRVEGSTFPNWTGTDQKRAVVSFSADEFRWTLPASIGGTSEVTWRRVK